MQLPAPFVERLHAQFPDRWSSLLDAYAQVPPVSVRINPRKIHLRLPADQVPWCEEGIYLP
ncbi:MAG: RNA methyltransferase, partial [Bacteroidetes bacterium]